MPPFYTGHKAPCCSSRRNTPQHAISSQSPSGAYSFTTKPLFGLHQLAYTRVKIILHSVPHNIVPVEFYKADALAESAETPQGVVCEVLWSKAVNTCVQMNLVIRCVRPLTLEDESRSLPHALRVTTVVAPLKWGLLLNVKDADTNREFFLQIPMRPESVTKIYDVDKSLVVEAFRERIPGIQACGSVPALLTGSSQSFTVTLYTGEILCVSLVGLAKGTHAVNRLSCLTKFRRVLGKLQLTLEVPSKEHRAS